MAVPATGEKPSAQQLAALEHAFAQAPTSDAYERLAEAYLALGRFMEAMVVSKQGLKARPTDPVPRLLLVRIYSEQGKDQKALEELANAVAAIPGDSALLKRQAALLLKTGQRGPGADALLKLRASFPDDGEIGQLMSQYGVEVPRVVAKTPTPAPVVAAPPAISPAGAKPIGAVPTLARAGRVAIPLNQAQGEARRATMTMASLDLSRLAEEEEARAAAQMNRRSSSLKVTGALILVGLVALGGFWTFNTWRNKRNQEIAGLLKRTQDELAKDSYAGYQSAEKLAQHALELDSSNFAAAAYLAYISALRFGENGEGESYLKRAKDFLAQAKAQNQPHAYIFAADAYLSFFTGDAKHAEDLLTTVLTQKGPSGERLYTSNLLSGTLGIIQLQEGKLVEARHNLIDAHNYAPADVRVTSALGTVDSRLGSPNTSEAFFQQALKIDPDHAPSLLGVALVELQQDPPDVASAEKQLTRLQGLGAGALSPRQDAFAKFMHAQLLYAQGKSGPASEEEKAAMALDSRNAEMALIVGSRLRRAGQPEKAIALLKHAIEIDPQRGAFYAELAEAYLDSPKGAPQAVKAFQDALARVPETSHLLLRLGVAYNKMGDWEHAQEAWNKAIKVDPDNGDAQLYLARGYLARGDLGHAKTQFEWVAKHAQGATLAEADTELGKLALAQGQPDRARELFESALGASPSYAPSYFYAGKVLLTDRTKKVQARQLFANYLKLSPDGPLAPEAKKLMH
jgi:tetratricopeptide (TPR) repeat protein